MKKQNKAVIWILALCLAIGLGIWDGLRNGEDPGTQPGATQVATSAGDELMEASSNIMKDSFLWHLRLKYPELLIWDTFFGSEEQNVLPKEAG